MDLPELASLLSKRAELETRLEGFGVWLIVFGVIVAIGVTGESIFAIKEWLNNRRLQAVQRDIDRLRDLEFSQQRERTATVELAVAKLLELARPRTVDPAARAAILDMLKGTRPDGPID